MDVDAAVDVFVVLYLNDRNSHFDDLNEDDYPFLPPLSLKNDLSYAENVSHPQNDVCDAWGWISQNKTNNTFNKF